KPISGPVLFATLTVNGGATYLAGVPAKGTIAIQNTGPQFIQVTAFSPASGQGTAATMYRGITNDYAKFTLTRWGHTNGPGHSPSSISKTTYTITNINYGGTAIFGTDFLASAQRSDPAGDGIVVAPTNTPTRSSDIRILPGDVSVVCAVGNPVPHTDIYAPP